MGNLLPAYVCLCVSMAVLSVFMLVLVRVSNFYSTAVTVQFKTNFLCGSSRLWL